MTVNAGAIPAELDAGSGIGGGRIIGEPATSSISSASWLRLP